MLPLVQTAKSCSGKKRSSKRDFFSEDVMTLRQYNYQSLDFADVLHQWAMSQTLK